MVAHDSQQNTIEADVMVKVVVHDRLVGLEGTVRFIHKSFLFIQVRREGKRGSGGAGEKRREAPHPVQSGCGMCVCVCVCLCVGVWGGYMCACVQYVPVYDGDTNW